MYSVVLNQPRHLINDESSKASLGLENAGKLLQFRHWPSQGRHFCAIVSCNLHNSYLLRFAQQNYCLSAPVMFVSTDGTIFANATGT
ncbi:hypothetical protein VN97_g9948 [Penicillium thymicola]|uniref:Uncharacterized protein n=1 Tax=Penicillium thymicola TaxID=293382 RepID=A0AAI9TB06_PENTH|nr:hypothetical protein VN97_g9948 [Penicillium thymicola]